MPRAATRTSNVYTRVDPDTKEQAEQILNQLGIKSAIASMIDLFEEYAVERGAYFRPALVHVEVERHLSSCAQRDPR